MNMPIADKRALIPLVLVVGVAALFVGLQAFPSEATSAPTSWHWSGGLLGNRTTPDALTAMGAESRGIDPSALWKVASTGIGRGYVTLYAGVDSNGDVCLSPRPVGRGGLFLCRPTIDRPLRAFPSAGGDHPDSVAYASVVGVARKDVAGVRVRLSNGEERPLTLNAAHAFAFSANSPAPLPIALTAYDTEGDVLQRLDLYTAPPCTSGAACGF